MDDQLKLSDGHRTCCCKRAPVHYGPVDGDPTCRFCRKETETVQHIILSAAARYWLVGTTASLGNPPVEPKDVSTASVRDLCVFIRGTGLLNVY
jgi:hypothetical protein